MPSQAGRPAYRLRYSAQSALERNLAMQRAHLTDQPELVILFVALLAGLLVPQQQVPIGLWSILAAVALLGLTALRHVHRGPVVGTLIEAALFLLLGLLATFAPRYVIFMVPLVSLGVLVALVAIVRRRPV